MEKETLATEMLRELKAQNKRQHITIIILIGVIVAMVIGFFIYMQQFDVVTEDESTIDMYQEDVDNSNMSGVIN